MKTAICKEHGELPASFVCKHLVATLSDSRRRGVHWLRAEDGCVNAWCDDCAARLEACGGEWDDESEGYAGVTFICEGCFRRIASMNGILEIN